jgi:hypothetical protein
VIKQANIDPIHVDKIRIPLGPQPGMYSPKLLSASPLEVAPETLDYARTCAQRVIDRQVNLPHTAEAGDLLAMAYAVLHFTKGA